MKNLFRLLTACTAGIALTSTSFALTWTDSDSIRVLLTDSHNGTGVYSNTFNILDAGYNPATMSVTSAVASFGFAEDQFNDADEYIDINLDSTLWRNDVEVDGSILSYDWVSGNLSGLLLASLQDGVIGYKVSINNTSGSNDVWLKEAKLVAQGGYKRGNTVPDGGATLVLLGLSFIGFAALRKRLF